MPTKRQQRIPRCETRRTAERRRRHGPAGLLTSDVCGVCVDQVVVEKEEAEAQFMATATRAIAEDAERDLAEALPALDLAVACLSKLKKVCVVDASMT